MADALRMRAMMKCFTWSASLHLRWEWLLVEEFDHVGGGFLVLHDAVLLHDLLLQAGVFLRFGEGEEIVRVVGKEEGFDGGFLCFGIGVALVRSEQPRCGRGASCDAQVAACAST